MKKQWILLFVGALGIVSCNEVPEEKRIGVAKIIATSDTESSCNRILQEKPFSNPAIFMGSDFISFLAVLKMVNPGNLDTLLTYTAKESIEKLGKKKVIAYYEKTNLIWKKKLKAVNKVGDTYFLSYIGLQMATRKNIVFEVKVENDTCRLVIQ
jgi:hypothetical protein